MLSTLHGYRRTNSNATHRLLAADNSYNVRCLKKAPRVSPLHHTASCYSHFMRSAEHHSFRMLQKMAVHFHPILQHRRIAQLFWRSASFAVLTLWWENHEYNDRYWEMEEWYYNPSQLISRFARPNLRESKCSKYIYNGHSASGPVWQEPEPIRQLVWLWYAAS